MALAGDGHAPRPLGRPDTKGHNGTESGRVKEGYLVQIENDSRRSRINLADIAPEPRNGVDVEFATKGDHNEVVFVPGGDLQSH